MNMTKNRTLILQGLVFVLLFCCSFQAMYDANSSSENNELDEYANNAAVDQKIVPPDNGVLNDPPRYNYTKIGNWTSGSSVRDVVVKNNTQNTKTYAYLAMNDGDLIILDVTNASNPTQVGFYNGNTTAYSVALDNDEEYAYVAYGSEGLIVLDISNKASPQKEGQVKATNDDARDILIDGNHAFVADRYWGINFIDVTTKSNPIPLINYSDGGIYTDLDIYGKWLYVIDRDYGLKVLDIEEISDIKYEGYGYEIGGTAHAVSLKGIVAYIADDTGLFVIYPFNPDIEKRLIRQFGDGNTLSDAYIYGNHHCFVTYSNNNGLIIFNTTDNSDISITGQYQDTGSGEQVVFYGYYAYIADGTEGLEIIQMDTDRDHLFDGPEELVYNTDKNKADTDSDDLNDYEEIMVYESDPNLNDTDNDALTDGEEVHGYYTENNPHANATGYITCDLLNNDTDDDGLLDGYEVITSLTNPNSNDSDNDGILDGDEVHIHLTNPNSSDTDNDTMTDSYEINYDLNPLVNDTQDDLDSDGLINLHEFQLNTFANDNDTDNDGLSDGDEVHGYYTEDNPHANATGYITTNPKNFDCDNDGLLDGEEVIEYLTNPHETDSDSDQLTDYEEVIIYNTNPNLSDTDEDEIPDFWEVEYGTNATRNDKDEDPDNDGLTNIDEYLNDCDPLNADTDGDEMEDGYEVQYGLDPLLNDGSLDKDGDGLSNINEWNAGTDPTIKDTDEDGMDDFWEVTYETDPLLDDSGNDYDSDGLTNLEEYENNADPWDTDTDNDKLTDYEEVKLYNTDPSAPDSDGDGFTDYTEIQSGTDPNDPNSNPDIRFRKMVIIIISSSIGVVALILGGFFGFFWYTRPKQKILRYIDNLRQEGKTKISVKHLRNYLDKQLNKGEIKQIIAESTSKGLTLEGNYVILMSPEKLIAREEEIVEKIAQHEQKPLSSEEIANLKKEINQLIDFSQKLEQSELVEKFKDLKNAVNKL